MEQAAMSQRERIKRHLEIFGSITPIEALQEYGCFRLAPRIHEIKQQYPVKTEMVERKNKFGETVRFARYSLVTL